MRPPWVNQLAVTRIFYERETDIVCVVYAPRCLRVQREVSLDLGSQEANRGTLTNTCKPLCTRKCLKVPYVPKLVNVALPIFLLYNTTNTNFTMRHTIAL